MEKENAEIHAEIKTEKAENVKRKCKVCLGAKYLKKGVQSKLFAEVSFPPKEAKKKKMLNAKTNFFAMAVARYFRSSKPV